ncbi:MFS transporter [Pseudonocardia sp. GCM10023141]|uniref:MFS transporter n=1 Tax=Pseudonocardia sp. GCM10023141 TaxID=3252653 RepID=UPI0036099553
MSVPSAWPSMRKPVLVSLAGSTIEWYDFFVYGSAAALVFNKLFFPVVDSAAGTLLAFSTFAVGFLIRPVGAALFGNWGDRVGRKPALITAMLLMGAATTAIGLLPTYSTVGVLAPVLLVLLRLLQGLALGGQWGGSVLLVTENAPPGRRGFYGSFAQLGVPMALILSNVVLLVVNAVMPSAAFETWGWRLPFLFSIVLIAVSLYAQSQIDETPAGAAAASGGRRRSPFVECLLTHPRQILLAAGATIVNGAVYYLVATYMLSFATQSVGVARSTILTGVLISAVVSAVTIPAAAALSDRIGRKRTFLLGAAGLAVWAFPLFLLVQTGSLVLITLALVVAQAIFSMTYGPAPALFTEMFDANVRYSGVSVGYQIGATLGGAFAPIIATALYGAFGSSTPISIYMIVVCLVSFLSVALVRQRSGTAPLAEQSGGGVAQVPAAGR